jgi:hypothetical protein
MMRAADRFKPGFVHIPAFATPGSAIPRLRGLYAFFFTSLMLEKTIPSARSLV